MVDCSAVVDALTFVEGTDSLRRVLVEEEMHAPSLLDFEVVSALRGLTLGGHLSAIRAEEALADFDDLPIARWPNERALRSRAFSLRDELSAYDAVYVVLADALGCPLVTRDKRLARGVGPEIDVRLL